MNAKAMHRRLAALEAHDKARLDRIRADVVAQLSDADLDTLIALVQRIEANPHTEPTDDEWPVAVRVNRLHLAHADLLPGERADYQQWQDEWDSGKHTASR